MKNMEAQLAQLFLVWLLLTVVAVALGIWIAYRVLKAGVRDGIRESGLVNALNRPVATARQPTGLPDMHADR
jgi:hypothetical protein